MKHTRVTWRLPVTRLQPTLSWLLNAGGKNSHWKKKSSDERKWRWRAAVVFMVRSGSFYCPPVFSERSDRSSWSSSGIYKLIVPIEVSRTDRLRSTRRRKSNCRCWTLFVSGPVKLAREEIHVGRRCGAFKQVQIGGSAVWRRLQVQVVLHHTSNV